MQQQPRTSAASHCNENYPKLPVVYQAGRSWLTKALNHSLCSDSLCSEALGKFVENFHFILPSRYACAMTLLPRLKVIKTAALVFLNAAAFGLAGTPRK